MKMLKKSVIVSAHPDDEILWFSSLLTRVDNILFCFLDEIADPDFGERRKKAVLHHPLKNVFSLELASFGAWKPQCFISPRLNKYGIEIAGEDVTHSVHTKKYEENYYELREKLSNVLREYQNVITHNPWGEYGHEEHIQVYRVVSDLQKEIGFDLWYSSYCSTRTVNLLIQCICVAEEATLPADISLARELMTYYEKNACWTWHKNWHWPVHETFFRQGNCASPDIKNVSIVPLNLILMPQMPPQFRKQPHQRKRIESIARKMSKWVLKRGRP